MRIYTQSLHTRCKHIVLCCVCQHQPLGLMEEPANRRNGAFTSQNSSLSSLDYSDLTLSLPEAGGREVRSQRRVWKRSHHPILYAENEECQRLKMLKAQCNSRCEDRVVYILPPVVSCRIKEVLCLDLQHPHHRIRDMGMLKYKRHLFFGYLCSSSGSVCSPN